MNRRGGIVARAVLVGSSRYLVIGFPLAVPAELTPAEADIARSVMAGESNRLIAARRETSPRTVANQLAQMYRKLGVGSRRELVARLAMLARAPRRTRRW